MTASDSRGSKSRLTNELTLRHAIGPLPSPQCREPRLRRWRCVARLSSPGSIFRLGASQGWPNLSEATKGATTCNLVELRGHALKNYEVTDTGKQGIATAMTKSDRHNSMFDREVNQFGTAAKSVHLHHLVLMEFDSSRGNRKLARNLLRRASFREQLQNLSLA